MPAAGEKNPELEPIPGKRYFTIGEAAKLCDLKPHVLRYWEQEFKQIQPVKRNNRRYYQRQDLLLIRQIRSLLYEQGLLLLVPGNGSVVTKPMMTLHATSS